MLRHAADKDVYVAREPTFGRRLVALDVFSNNAVMPSGLTVSAWEAQVLGQLDAHPNIGTVIDHWEDDEAAFMVSRYLPGGSLAELIERHREGDDHLPVGKILDLATQIASGLEHIHRCRILYRDLQPRNVLFDDWGVAHLVDFDTAVSLDEPEQSDMSSREHIEYLPPEALDGVLADERSDLYSFGATLYEMCCGHPPHVGGRSEILTAHQERDHPCIARMDLSEGLRELILSLLAHDREDRPESAGAVLVRLAELQAARDDLQRFLSSNETAVLRPGAPTTASVGRAGARGRLRLAAPGRPMGRSALAQIQLAPAPRGSWMRQSALGR